MQVWNKTNGQKYAKEIKMKRNKLIEYSQIITKTIENESDYVYINLKGEGRAVISFLWDVRIKRCVINVLGPLHVIPFHILYTIPH